MKQSLYLLFLLTFTVFGQEPQKIDSIKTVLETTTEETERLDGLNAIIRAFIYINMDSTRVYNDKVIQIAKTTNDQATASKAYNVASVYYYYNSQIDSSLYYVKKSLESLKKSSDHKLKSDLYRKLAILSRALSNEKDNIDYARLALKEAKLAENWPLESSAMIAIANHFLNNNDHLQALTYYLKVDSLHIVNDTVTRDLNLTYENIALIYSALKNEKALDYLDKSQAIFSEKEDEFGLANLNRLRGNYYSLTKQHALSIEYYRKCLPFFESHGDPMNLIETYTDLSINYVDNLDGANALVYLNKAKELAKEYPMATDFTIYHVKTAEGKYNLFTKQYEKAIASYLKVLQYMEKNANSFYLDEKLHAYDALVFAYEGLDQYKKALEYSKITFALNDSINKKNKEEITTNLEAKYQTEKREREISLLKSKNALNEQKQHNQQNMLIGGIGLATLSSVFFFVLYRNRKRTTDRLKEMDMAKSNFFTNVSHEFRTPLTLISGPIQQQLDKKNLPPKEKDNLEIAQQNTSRLLSLVNQLLDISKIESSSYPLKVSKGELSPFIGSLIDGFSFAAKEKKINLSVDIQSSSENTWFDRDIVERVMVNLMSNALKYTPKGGSIDANALVKNGKLQLTISNTGNTLTKEAQARLFERFYRADDTQQGAGIGLALVKELVQLHKGSINVSSSAEELTTFSMALPVKPSDFAESERRVQKGKISSLKNEITLKESHSNPPNPAILKEDSPILLIVDDNTDIRTYVGNMFNETYNVVKAKNGAEGVQLALEYIPDIVISDVMMPIKNGLELCETLKNDERTSHIPIILLTAKAGEENELDGVKTGADDYITKPFHEGILKERVKNLIDVRKKLQLRYSQEVVLRPKDIAITTVDEKFLTKLQQIMDEKLTDPSFSVVQFCEAVGMSRMQLHRKLKALLGFSTTEFICNS
ncbi:response regulator [Flagellimonas onchidii]|uniref:response regulator n=1 Tax=Flagellimonas onchidii TaxID=2562684 RepID=UPI0010A65FDF|nr:response regulator [Allomuricauda onchidii]